jgi:hypothetical protein
VRVPSGQLEAGSVHASGLAARAGPLAGRLLVIMVTAAIVTSGLASFPAAAAVDVSGPHLLVGGDQTNAYKPQSKVWYHDGVWWASMVEVGGTRVLLGMKKAGIRLSRCAVWRISRVDDAISVVIPRLRNAGSSVAILGLHPPAERREVAGPSTRWPGSRPGPA